MIILIFKFFVTLLSSPTEPEIPGAVNVVAGDTTPTSFHLTWLPAPFDLTSYTVSATGPDGVEIEVGSVPSTEQVTVNCLYIFHFHLNHYHFAHTYIFHS